MKLNNKIISVLVLLLATITVMTSEVLSQRRFKPHKRPGLILEMLADELELTEEQLTEIKEQRVATEKSSIELRSNIQIAELELRELLRQDNPDENQIISKIEEIGKLKTELRLTRVQGRLAIKKVLTS
ncbi:MAG: Spy/CpxP family protein refolding chaperone, partial [bacterium]